MTDVLLIAAPLGVRTLHAQLSPPLGLALIGASLEQAGIGVTALDFNLSGLNPLRLQGLLEFEQPRIVGISAYTETWTSTQEIAATVAKTLPKSTIVLGGIHPSLLPEECLSTSNADYVISGPGEKSFTRLAHIILENDGNDTAALRKAVQDAHIAGLSFWEAGKVKTIPAEPLGDPNKLPWADRSLFPLARYKDRCTVLTATGSCPYRCSFCSASAFWAGRHLSRSVDDVISELRMLAARGITDVFFSDDIFTLNKTWVLDLCSALQQADFNLTWGCATRIDRVDDELLEMMTASGCDGIQFGIESGAADILQSVKGIDKNQIRHAVSKARALDIKVLCSFMVPFPEDTLDTLAETKAFIKELKALGADIGISYTCPYPGTLLYEKADEFGLHIIPQDWSEFSTRSPMIETKYLSAQQIEHFMNETIEELGFVRTVTE